MIDCPKLPTVLDFQLYFFYLISFEDILLSCRTGTKMLIYSSAFSPMHGRYIITILSRISDFTQDAPFTQAFIASKTR